MKELTCNVSLKQKLVENLNRFDRKPILDDELKHAAVAIVITNCTRPANIARISFNPAESDQAAFILTTRSSQLSNHRGQRAFPGGRIDPGESIERAALRELHEEISLDISDESILGLLDDYSTRSGYIITPVVVWAGMDAQCEANPDEVEKVHLVPVKELLRENVPILESIPESDNPVLKMPIGDEWFAAPTAAIAYQFREVALLGKTTRVAHFEQPYFAWR
jgi:8-oxo-dGTP pyrophosphatase MutT (NUDIX family)